MYGNHIISQPTVFYEQILPNKLVELIYAEYQEKMPVAHLVDGQVGDGLKGETILETRDSKIAWLLEDHWGCGIMEYYIKLANVKNWEYELNRIESIQVTIYDSGCHYTWHSDYGTSTNKDFTRKLSASLLISDPSEYEGGDLQFVDYHNNIVTAPKKKGSIIVFDSRIPHRVTPVTKGRRVSLVTWMYGPKLK